MSTANPSARWYVGLARGSLVTALLVFASVALYVGGVGSATRLVSGAAGAAA